MSVRRGLCAARGAGPEFPWHSPRGVRGGGWARPAVRVCQAGGAGGPVILVLEQTCRCGTEALGAKGDARKFRETSFSLCNLTPVLRFSLVVHTWARGVVHLFCSGAQDQTLLVPELEPELSPRKLRRL